MKILSILVLFFAVLNSNAQPFGSLEQLKTRFPDQPIVYILKDENIDIKNDKAGLVIIKHVKEQMMIMNESAKNFKTRSVFASSFIEIKNIKAFNYIKNGNKYTKTLIDNIKVNDSNSDGVFYDGSKKLTITYNNSEPGSVFELEYDEVYLEPRFFGSFYLTENYPVIKANCTINCPNSVKLNIKNFNLTNLKIKSTEKPAKNSIIYNWTIDSLKEYKYEEYGPDYRSLAGYKLFNIEEYTKDGTTIPLVGTVNNLYKWYRGLVKNKQNTFPSFKNDNRQFDC